MVKHIVVWTLRDEFEGMDKVGIAREMKSKLENLKSLIHEIKHLEVGINTAYPEKNADIVLVSDFENLAALDKYIGHPEHIKAGAFVKQVVLTRSSVDYEY